MADTTRGARGMSAGIVLWHVTMSLDGFIAGPDDAMDWVFEYAEPNPARTHQNDRRHLGRSAHL
jgi:hypothetical protein